LKVFIPQEEVDIKTNNIIKLFLILEY
jgi:hypothetical protein